ncbi:sorting and assembly machinery component 50 homolog [Galendromus occidentalis]|uniref:Sorting and assembly machinery component 50 homolog n=1 Tax=Galendromus occidentalis TaxID=34638 RepID=A0AAJ6QRA7_9ACAR|nr:sorting and assembly machinery component 50 homolog [Galendromus occidentalis]
MDGDQFFPGVQPARVDKVHFENVGRTKNDVLAKAVQTLMDCTTFTEILLKCAEARRQLDQLGAFKRIDVEIQTSKSPGATEHGYEVIFDVEEKKTISGGVNGLVANNEGTMVMGAQLPNVGGRGEFIQAQVQYGTKHSSGFNITASKPFLGKRNSRFTVAAYEEAADYPWNAFRERIRGVLAEYSFRSLPSIDHSLRWEGVWRELNPLGITVPFPVREQMGHSLKSALKHIMTIDTTDNPVLPTEGFSLRVCSEVAGHNLGGDIRFVKNELEHQMNFSLFNDLVLQLTANAGHMTPNEQHNISDKFFLGGPLGLRGFKLRGVGPQCEGASLGGTTYWSTGCHLYSPLPFRRGHGYIGEYLRLHGFVTAGSLSEGVDSAKLQDPSVSAGLGVVLSLGHQVRIELNYAVPLRHQRSDRTNSGLQFGMGMAFL